MDYNKSPRENTTGQIVFIDSEITNEGIIGDLGAVTETAQFHSANTQEFSRYIKGNDFICGHNIIHHDSI